MSMPYGRSTGSCVNSTPLAFSDSYSLRQSLVVKPTLKPEAPVQPYLRIVLNT